MQVTVNPPCKQLSPAATSSTLSNNRAKRKSRFKLKFHHQALPAKYLDHYEATLQQNAKPKAPAQTTVSASPALSPQLLLCRATTTTTATAIHRTTPTTSSSAILKSLATSPTTATSQLPLIRRPPSALGSTVRYKDLPYMGEMTLDNARPRRGRKPKKADICHLIYKNYGTTVVDEPLNLCLRDLQMLRNAAAEAGTDPSSGRQGDGDEGGQTLKFEFAGSSATTTAIPTLCTKRNATTPDCSTTATGTLRLLEKRKASRSCEMKRKNRNTLTREKLEKTFKERGFLIQTQRLESAQGATYCKFRQLRKFTRYLFRSWKHHLPGDIINNSETGA